VRSTGSVGVFAPIDLGFGFDCTMVDWILGQGAYQLIVLFV